MEGRKQALCCAILQPIAAARRPREDFLSDCTLFMDASQ